MPESFKQLLQRARSCPVACFMKVIFLLLFIVAAAIAGFFQYSMTKHEYAGFIIAIGYVAVLALAAHRNCRLNLEE